MFWLTITNIQFYDSKIDWILWKRQIMNENLMHSEVCTPLFLNIEDEKVRRMFFQDVIKIMNENLYYSEVFMYSLFLHL